MLKIYKIWQTVNKNYDTFDSAIVVAENEEEARKMNPLTREKFMRKVEYTDFGDDEEPQYNIYQDFSGDIQPFFHNSWVKNINDVNVEYIGEAKDGMKKGVIVGSFNAG